MSLYGLEMLQWIEHQNYSFGWIDSVVSLQSFV